MAREGNFLLPKRLVVGTFFTLGVHTIFSWKGQVEKDICSHKDVCMC